MSLNFGFSEEKQSLAAVEKCFQISSHNGIVIDFLSMLDDVRAKVDAYNAESLSEAGCLRELVDVDEYGNKTYSYNEGRLLKKYDKNSLKIQSVSYNDDMSLKSKTFYFYDENDVLSSEETIEYYQKGLIGSSEIKSEDDEWQGNMFFKYSEDGKLLSTIRVTNKLTIQNIFDRELFNYEQLSLKDVVILAELNHSDWLKASKYFALFPHVSAEKVLNFLNGSNE